MNKQSSFVRILKRCSPSSLASWNTSSGSRNCTPRAFFPAHARKGWRSRICRTSSSWTGRGQDFLGDAFTSGQRPKVLLEAIGPSGFDVSNLIKKIDPNEVAPHGALHMTGSILAFPNACYLWRVDHPSDVTLESLSPVLLYRPQIEFLFVGTNELIDRKHSEQLKKDMKQKSGIVLEWLPLVSAIDSLFRDMCV